MRSSHTNSPGPTRRLLAGGLIAAALIGPRVARADDRAKLVDRARVALQQLQASDPRAARLAGRARAVLVFPTVLKAGLVFGAETGNGVLFMRGQPERFFNISGGSWGLQIGGQGFSYALFFMTEDSLRYLRRSGGFAGGTLPSVVVVNKGAAADVDTTTALKAVYAFPFNQRGLMANLTLEGTKITPIHPH